MESLNTPKEIQEAIRSLPEEDFNVIRRWIFDEIERRKTAPKVEEGQAEIIKNLRDQGIIETNPEPENPEEVDDYPIWKNPGTIHSRMYLYGDRVRHNFRVYESNHPGLNHWEPGATGIDYRIWRDITEDIAQVDTGEEIPGDSNQTTAWSTGTAYQPGDIVSYNGDEYEVTQGHTSQAGWTPDAVPALFRRL